LENIIAKVRIAPGEIGYYDEVSGVHLNQSNPIAEIKAGTNCSVLRRSVKCRRLILLEGSLGRPRTLFEILHPSKSHQEMVITPVKEEPKVDTRKVSVLEVTKDEKAAKDVEESKVKVSAAKEEVVEEAAEKVAEEKPKKKTTRKKKEDTSAQE
jgi:hypothetical protein